MISFGTPLQILLIYYLVINVLLFLFMGLDKRKAIKHKWRIPESTLFFLALLGGAVGGLVGMSVFHHKNKIPYIIR